MAGFADLVARAQPALATVEGAATEARSWKWTFTDIVDDDGNPVDMATGITGTCKLMTSATGSALATLTYTGGVGTFKVSLTPSASAGLAGASTTKSCFWFCKVTDGTNTLDVWGAADSRFIIRRAGS